MATSAPDMVPDTYAGRFFQSVRDFGESTSRTIYTKCGELKAASKRWAITIGQVGKNVSDSVDPMYRGIAETIQVLDTQEKTDAVARPGLAGLHNAISFLDLAWFVKSIRYVTCGDLKEDIKNGNLWSIATQAALLVARAISTIHWFAKQKLIDLDKMAQKALSIGGTRLYNVANAVKGTNVMLCAFALGFTGLLRGSIQGIQSGENQAHHAFSAISTVSYIAMMVLSVKKFANPGALAAIGVTAAVTGFAAYLANRQ